MSSKQLYYNPASYQASIMFYYNKFENLIQDYAIEPGLLSYENINKAGGMNSENIYSLLSQLIPWGVDISSGLETNGEKDLKKISTFINRVRAYNKN